MTADAPTPLTADERAQLRDVWHMKRGACDEDCAAILYEVAESILLARETALRENIAQAWDEGHDAQCESSMCFCINPYRGQT